MLRQFGLIDSNDPDGSSGGGGGPVDPPPVNPPDPPPGPSPNPEETPEGPPPQAPQGPPQSAISGVSSSDVTGGVQGSFGQAGTADFSRRFGTGQGPANWFRNAASQGRPIDTRRATTAGGSLAGGAPTPPPLAGGQPDGQDAEWQRFMQEVTRQRFGR